MTISNYPNGFLNGVTVRGLPITQTHPGEVFFVNNSTTAAELAKGAIGGSNGNKGTYTQPFATIDYAVSKCKAGRGDMIMAMPGHAETLSAADAIDMDVAGVALIGLGVGENRPTLNFDNAAGEVVIGADDVVIKNMRFVAGITAVLKAIDVEAGNDDFTIEDCSFTCTTLGTDEFLDTVLVAAGCNRGVVRNNHVDMDEAGAQSAVNLSGAVLGCEIYGNTILGDFAVANIEHATSAAEQLIIKDNTLVNGAHSGLNTLACINLASGTTGFIHDNMLYTDVATPVTGAIVAAGCFLGENRVSTTAESTSFVAEGGLAGATIVKSAVKTGIADDAVDDLFALVGTVDVYGIVLTVTTASDSDQTMGIFFDSTSTNDDLTIHALANHDLNAVGDTLSGTVAGAIWAETTVPGDTTPIWTSPLRLPAGEIETLVGGTGGALVSSVTLYYSLVSPDATVTVS